MIPTTTIKHSNYFRKTTAQLDAWLVAAEDDDSVDVDLFMAVEREVDLRSVVDPRVRQGLGLS